PPAQDGQNNVLPQIPNPAGQHKLLVPDSVNPGLRVVYRGSSSLDAPPPNPDRQPAAPMNLGSAAIGPSTVDVKAVTDPFMIVGSENYLTDINTNPHDLIGTATFFANQQTVMVGGAFFIHPDELAKMQSGDGVEVVRGPSPINGQNVEA